MDAMCWIVNNASTSQGFASKTLESQPKSNATFEQETCNFWLAPSSSIVSRKNKYGIDISP